MKKLLIYLLWLPAAVMTLFLSLGVYATQYTEGAKIISLEATTDQTIPIPYQFYASVPKVLGDQSTDAFYVKSQDTMPKLIESYMKKHKSPMIESYQDLINAATKYGLDPLFMVAIAQCESNMGLKMPHPDSSDPYSCHNPFGWGIHSQGTLCFDTWQEGYEAVAKGLRSKYFNKGYDTTEDIMTKYTPPALEKNGSWAKCVNHFTQELSELREKM